MELEKVKEVGLITKEQVKTGHLIDNIFNN